MARGAAAPRSASTGRIKSGGGGISGRSSISMARGAAAPRSASTAETAVRSGRGGGESGEVAALDRVTSLPVDLIGRVISFLSVDQGARTAILSRQMRYVWRTTLLTIDDSRFDRSSNLQLVSRLIRGATEGHTGHVERLVFRRLSLKSLFHTIGDWVGRPIFGGICELTLSFPGKRSMLPQAVLGFSSLKLLDLRNCAVSRTLMTLPSLRSLRLVAVDIPETTLNDMIFNAKQLHTLVLHWNGGHSLLSLSHPALRCLIVHADPSSWIDQQQLENLFVRKCPNLDRMLVRTVGVTPLTITINESSVPCILGNLGKGALSLRLGNTKLEGMSISSMDVAKTWANIKVLSLEVKDQDLTALERYLRLFPCLGTLHILFTDSSVGNDVEISDLVCDSDEPVECLRSSLSTIVLRFYTSTPKQTQLARRLLESAAALHIFIIETEFVRSPEWLKTQRYALNFDSRASKEAQIQFSCEGDARYPSVEREVNASDPFILSYAPPYHIIKAEATAYLFQAEFVVTSCNVLNQDVRLPQLNPTIVFDEVSLIKAYSKEFDMHMELDVATWVYYICVGEKLLITFASTLNLDGTPDGGCFTRDSIITLAKYEHCMSGRIYNITKDIAGRKSTCEILASFGGLKMRLKGSRSLSAIFGTQQNIFLLMCKGEDK